MAHSVAQAHFSRLCLHFQCVECSLERGLHICLLIMLNCVKSEFSRAVLAHISECPSHGVHHWHILKIVYFECPVLLLHTQHKSITQVKHYTQVTYWAMYWKEV